MRILSLLSFLTILFFKANAQQIIKLYEGKPIGNIDNVDREETFNSSSNRSYLTHVTNPTILFYKPKHVCLSNLSILICPGGGYNRLSIFDGGKDIANQLNALGINVFVLKYRTNTPNSFYNYSELPFMDLERAFSIIRDSSDKWNIDCKNIGIMGLSAGGHLAAMKSVSLEGIRPAFTILAYPVISFTDELSSEKTTSRKNLMGDKVSNELKIKYSAELHVTEKTPPAFIVAAEDDSTVLVGNSLAYFNALVAKRIKCQLQIYQSGGHGFALYNKLQDEYWLPQAIKWMRFNQFLK